MKWMRLATAFPRDAKIRSLTRSERLFYIELLLWSMEQETAGRIPSSALGAIGDGHKGKARSLKRMQALGLIEIVHDPSVGPTSIPTYDVVNFAKWQMVTERNTHKPAGQAPGDQSSSRAGAGARTERRTDIDIYLSEDTLAPAAEVKDPRLAAVLGRLTNMNGSTHG